MNLTFDHLLPRSKGGKTNWENVVTACSSCNVQKGGKIIRKIRNETYLYYHLHQRQKIYIKMEKIFHQIFYMKVGWTIYIGM